MEKTLERFIMAEAEWSHAFEEFCNAPNEEQAQTYAEKIRCELSELGHDHRPCDVADALFDIARGLCPDSFVASDPAFVEWAFDLWRQALRFLVPLRPRSSSSWPGDPEDHSEQFWGCRVDYRNYVRSWTKDAKGRMCDGFEIPMADTGGT